MNRDGESGREGGVREMIEFLSRGSEGDDSPDRPEGILWSPSADVYEADGHLFVTVDVAGMKSKEFRIRVEGDTLIIRGERRPPHDRRERRYYAMERHAGPFEKRVPLPGGCEHGRPRSRYVDGVLEVSFPLAPGEGRNR